MNCARSYRRGIATICGDVLYDINDQLVDPFREIHDAEPRTTGNHGTSSARKRRPSRSSSTARAFCCRCTTGRCKIEDGNVVGRLQDQVPGPIVQSLPKRNWFPAMSAGKDRPHDPYHAALRIRNPDRSLCAASARLGTGFTFTEGPIWHPVDHYLLFSDMPADVRRRWDATRGVSSRSSALRTNAMA